MRIRPSTLAVIVAVLLVFAGLVLALQKIRESEGDSRRADARVASAATTTFFALRAEALHAMDGLFLDNVTRPSAERFATLERSSQPQLSQFRRVWIADSAGVLLYETTHEVADTMPPPGADIDTLRDLELGALAAAARRSAKVTVSGPVRLLNGEPGVVLLQVVSVDGVARGFVGGSVPLAALRDSLIAQPSLASRAATVLATAPRGGDTVLALPTVPAGVRTEATLEPVRLPNGDLWYLSVHHRARSTVQLELFGVALAGLLALVVGAGHERRQTQRIADRSRELEHLSQELLRANQAKSEFLANVSHELRTPLNAIVGFTELLRDGVYGEVAPRQVSPLQRIEASASHLRVLVDQVLDLAKIAAGRLEVHREPVELRQVVLDTATELESLFAERRLSVTLALGSHVPRLRTDPTLVRQILVNLLGNAVKFTETGGVTVRTRLVHTTNGADGAGGGRAVVVEGTPAVGTTAVARGEPRAAVAQVAAAAPVEPPDSNGSWVLLQVIDTGVGIAERDRERIFDEFEQVLAGSRGDSDHRGTGLGLPISRRLARLLGGDLRVERGTGHGSTFSLWLPVEERDGRDRRP